MAKSTRTKFVLDTKVLDGMIKHLDGNTTEAVETLAFMVEGRAKVNIQQMDAIDTGALLNSTSVSMKGGGDMNQAIAAARQLRPEAVITPLPVPQDKHTAHVGPTVEYGEEVHFGSGTMAGRPFLLKALRETEKDAKRVFGKAIRDGK